jgi:putative Mg2+ transporter-C (MgtC) family protein
MHPATLSPLEILARLALALLLGSLVGLERERGERAAGLRTHALVCLGAALIMLVSSYGLNAVANGTTIIVDPSRIAAQVVSGIGFLGAGMILLRREIVKGLTTAAGIWVVAGIGLATGAGLYLTAVIGTAGTLLILAALKPIEDWLFGPRRAQRLILRVYPQPGQLTAIHDACQHSGVRLRTLTLQIGESEEAKTDQSEETIRLEFYPSGLASIDRLTEQLRAIPGLIALEVVIPGQATKGVPGNTSAAHKHPTIQP